MRPMWTWTCKQNQLVAMLGWVLALGMLSCAEGAPADPPMHIEPPVPMMEPPCGNGVMDQGEKCDCPKVGGKPVERCPLSAANMTCVTLGFTGGDLLCNK